MARAALLTFVGRVLIAALFLIAGYNHIVQFTPTKAHMMEVMHVTAPIAAMLLRITIGLLVVGGLSVLIGYKAKFGAFLLVVFLLSVTPVMHNFWAVPAEQFQMQLINFEKNAAILGGLLLLMAWGPGAVSVDGERKPPAG
jgi:putative oxidoreductase